MISIQMLCNYLSCIKVLACAVDAFPFLKCDFFVFGVLFCFPGFFFDTASRYRTENSHLTFAFILQLCCMFTKVKFTFGSHRNMAEINNIWFTIAAVN